MEWCVMLMRRNQLIHIDDSRCASLPAWLQNTLTNGSLSPVFAFVHLKHWLHANIYYALLNYFYLFNDFSCHITATNLSAFN